MATISNGIGRTIAIRADMDALPIEVQTGHSFQLEYQGIMHACGHDPHTAMLLGVTKILADRAASDAFQGTVIRLENKGG